MRTKDRSRDQSTRVAWRWNPGAPPPISDLLAGGDRRRGWFRHHVSENIQNGLDIATHFALKLVPDEACSRFGGQLGRFVAPRYHAAALARTRANLAAIRPDLGPEEREAATWRNWDNQGRLHTEFSIVHRLDRAGRITLKDADHALAARAAGPVVLLCLHLGNWEAIGPAMLRLGMQPTYNYMPQESRARNWISKRVRASVGVKLMPAGAAAARPSLRLLKEGGVVGIFGDEGFNGRIMAPFFHRTPHVEGNLAIAVRLARHAGARILPVYARRVDGRCRFEVTFLPAVELEPTDDPAAHLLADVIRLNGVIEPVIRANADQWYFLDNQL